MIEYRDTGAPDDDVCPGRWFDENLVDGIQAFRGQFGFFRSKAIRKYSDVLRTMATSGKIVNLVLGSNSSDPLTYQDVRELLRLLAAGSQAHLAVVAFGNAFFHPKVAHVVHQDGTIRAIVGSANMTEQALGIHVEAWVEVASGHSASDRALGDIVAAIDRWQTVADEGVYQVRTEADADRLLANGILIDAAARRARRAAAAVATSPSSGRGTRRARWRPPVVPGEPSLEDEAETIEVAESAVAATPVGRIILRWSKKLSRSDVNKLETGHARNLLSLVKAGCGIDLSWFRNVFFADAPWVPKKAGKSGFLEETTRLRFKVKLPAKKLREIELEVGHAPHRGPKEEYYSYLKWEGWLSKVLQRKAGKGYAEHWVLLEKDEEGRYWITIAADEPAVRFIGPT